jgi:single-stranded-DNA-specific exonuclease
MTQRSFKNRPWNVAAPQHADVQALQNAAGIGRLEAFVLAGRGITPSTIGNFMDPRLKTEMPDPTFFLGMSTTADRLVQAILSDERIAIWSDYDVDGATSAAVLGRFLRANGVEHFDLYIPDRIHEGYGPNATGMAELAAKGVTLVCVLDSGTTAFDALASAKAAGLDVLVVDHHMAEDTLPEAVAVVNPNRRDQPAGFNHVCAAGMAFLLCVETNRRLRLLGQPGMDLMPLVGLVALGTVCDVVPLKTLNRAFVARGLPILSQRGFVGVKALAEAAGVEGDIDVGVCGFGLGPRINAGGRIGDSTLGARLLLTDDENEARSIAAVLDRLNKERQDLEKLATGAAIASLEKRFVAGETRALALAVVEAHEGVVGISAARVKESFDAPAFVLAPSENGLLKGSGRSVKGFDLGAAVVAARQAGLLVKGGGHAMAAGITIEPAQLDAFIAFVDAAIAVSDYGRDGVALDVDAEVHARDLSVEWVEQLAALGPFGMGNPTPRFLLKNVRVVDRRILKEKHLKLRVQDASGNGKRFDAPLWNAVGTPLEMCFTLAGERALDLVCAIEINEWNGSQSIQLKLEDARLVEAMEPAAEDVPF